MTIEETYNIHKRINCVFRHFKSKWLCKHGIHNFQIRSKITYMPVTYTPFNPKAKQVETEVQYYTKKLEIYWKCYCCGKEEKFDD